LLHRVAVDRRLSVALVFFCGAMASGCSENIETQPDNFTYTKHDGVTRCSPSLKPDADAVSDGERTTKGIRYFVRSPANYDATYRHALIVVFSPAGTSALQTERLMKFTRSATRTGFIVAFADHARLGLSAVQELATIAQRVSEKWCIDSQRVFLTGHSDGGTVSQMAAVLPEFRGIARAIAPSAAGVTAADLSAYSCPQPLAAMIMHSKNDKVFPDFGRQTSRWWAQCNRCDIDRFTTMTNGCIAFERCAPHAPTWYCEGDGSHAVWPDQNQTIIEFFRQGIQ
jgi:polyhydroxybutyrate depolymerase